MYIKISELYAYLPLHITNPAGASLMLHSSILEVLASILGGEPSIRIKYFAISCSISMQILGHYFELCHDVFLRNPYPLTRAVGRGAGVLRQPRVVE
jgi:hypothetical protein